MPRKYRVKMPYEQWLRCVGNGWGGKAFRFSASRDIHQLAHERKNPNRETREFLKIGILTIILTMDVVSLLQALRRTGKEINSELDNELKFCVLLHSWPNYNSEELSMISASLMSLDHMLFMRKLRLLNLSDKGILSGLAHLDTACQDFAKRLS